MVLVAGVLVDRFGLKFSGTLYSSLCVVGAALTALGASPWLHTILGSGYVWIHGAFWPDYSAELKVMSFGRVLYGLGAEAILVVNNKVLARWSKGRELALAFGLSLTIMRLGTFLALWMQVPVAKYVGLSGSLWVAAGIMALGLLSFFLYLAIEKASSARYTLPVPATASEEKFRLREVYQFDASFWLITLLCVTFYSAAFPFQAYAPDILVQRFGVSENNAGKYASALILGTMICTPLCGWMVDRIGRRATFMIGGSPLLISCHLLLGFTHFPPVVPIFAVGVALSLVPAALWAAVPLMVPSCRVGTAFGLIGYVQNVGLLLFPWLAGKIADAHTISASPATIHAATLQHAAATQVAGPLAPVQGVVDMVVELLDMSVSQVDYAPTLLMFACLGILGFALALLLRRADARRKDGFSIEKVAREQARHVSSRALDAGHGWRASLAAAEPHSLQTRRECPALELEAA